LQAQKDFADALALQAACLGMLAELKPWRVPFAGPRSSTQIHKALQLAPRNPRVLLLDAIGDYERPKSPGGDTDRAIGKFKKAVAAFEAEREGLDQVPGWGAAEAYTFLARSYLDRGDAIAARDALERALLIAPEFLQARRLMTRITGGLS
jgi:tetratricopeptide (TPR) repeat protein